MPRASRARWCGAEADGLKGHGLSRVPMYAAQAKVRKVDGLAVPVADAAAAGPDRGRCRARLRLSGDRARRSRAARRRAQRRASPRRRSAARSHCGAAGQPVERLAREGPGRADVRQHAGARWRRGAARRPVFGTNPIAFACPLPGRAPLVIDLSLSKVARGNVMAAKQRGETIPEGWALDDEGPADHRSRRGARAAPWCRWATPRAPRWR